MVHFCKSGWSLDNGPPNCNFSRIPAGEFEDFVDHHLYSEGKTCMVYWLGWLMQPQWVLPKSMFMRQLRAICWFKTIRSASCTTRAFSLHLLRCKGGHFHNNLLVTSLTWDRAAHGIALRWNQEDSCNPFVVFPAFEGRILKTAARDNGNLRVGLSSELSFEHFVGRRTSLSNKSHVKYNILPWRH